MRKRLSIYLIIMMIIYTGCAQVYTIELDSFIEFKEEVIEKYDYVDSLDFNSINNNKGISLACDIEIEYTEVLVLFDEVQDYFVENEAEIIEYQTNNLMNEGTTISISHLREDRSHITYEFECVYDEYVLWNVTKFDTSLDVVADYEFDEVNTIFK